MTLRGMGVTLMRSVGRRRHLRGKYGMPVEFARKMDEIYAGAMKVIAKAKAEGKFWMEKDAK